MPINEILNEINNILKEIIKKTESIDKDKDKLSLIELDLIKDDIRNLYEHFNKLETPQVLKPCEVLEKAHEKPIKRKVKSENDKEQTATFTHKIEIKAPEIKKEEIVTEQKPVEETVLENETVAEIKQPKLSASDLFTLDESELIADKFKDEGKSINDKMGLDRTDKSIADKLKNVHTSDIKTLIGINEKFLFINELFDGNMSEYNDFITQINLFDSKIEADKFVNNLKTKKSWKNSLDSLNKLQELIEVRYSL